MILLFYGATKTAARNVKDHYCKASSQSVNLYKSKIKFLKGLVTLTNVRASLANEFFKLNKYIFRLF